MDDQELHNKLNPSPGDMYRWQGATEAILAEHSRRLNLVEGDAKATREAAEQTLVAIAVLKVKVALWASIGSLLGAGAVSAIVTVLTRGHP